MVAILDDVKVDCMHMNSSLDMQLFRRTLCVVADVCGSCAPKFELFRVILRTLHTSSSCFVQQMKIAIASFEDERM